MSKLEDFAIIEYTGTSEIVLHQKFFQPPIMIIKVAIKYFSCRIFEQRCINIMDRMLEENKERTLKLLDSKRSVWGIKSNPLTFAHENFMYDVIAHTCSQTYMNKKWYSNLPRGKWDFSEVNTGLSFNKIAELALLPS